MTTNSFRVSLGHNFNVLNLDSDDSCVPLSTYHKAPKCENKIIILWHENCIIIIHAKIDK